MTTSSSQGVRRLPPPTPEFLEELKTRARIIGWGAGDYVETVNFVQAVYDQAGKSITAEELEPFEEEEG